MKTIYVINFPFEGFRGERGGNFKVPVAHAEPPLKGKGAGAEIGSTG
jgi:hypothetical protein